jgi:hypothetical protein
MRAYPKASARALVTKWRVRARTVGNPLEDEGMAWYQIFDSLFGSQPVNAIAKVSVVDAHTRMKASWAADCLFKIAHRGKVDPIPGLPSMPRTLHRPPACEEQ